MDNKDLIASTLTEYDSAEVLTLNEPADEAVIDVEYSPSHVSEDFKYTKGDVLRNTEDDEDLTDIEDLYEQGMSESTPLLVGHSAQLLAETESAEKSLVDDYVPSSVTQSIFNSVNLLVGVGILSLPYAFKVSGWYLGGFLLLAFCLFTRYTAMKLAECMDTNGSFKTYADVGEGAFGKTGRAMISVFFMVELIVASVALAILSADSIATLLPSLDTRLIKLGVFLVFTPSTWSKSLSHLTIASMLGVFTILALFSILLGEGLSHKEMSPGNLLHPARTDPWPRDWSRTPLCIGLISAGFSGHAVFASIKSQMAEPKKFPRVVNVSYLVTALLYLAFAAVGYLMFGQDTMVEVSQNLPRIHGYPRALAVVTIMVVIVNPFTKFALTVQPVCLTAEQYLAQKFSHYVVSHPNATRICNRTTVCMFVISAAIVVPGFDRIMSILGSLFSMMVSVIIPIAMYLKIFQRNLSPLKYLWNVVLLVVGSLLALTGTAYGIFY